MLLPSTTATGQTNLLKKIDSPKDIRKLQRSELAQLAQEIRAFLIDSVSNTGGHISPNLGVVELTLALHYVFDTPVDKLIWDVGHQCYAHKLITGRRDTFHTLRQYQGISGFPKISESEYDSFETGHSSTSISVALGMALAKDLKHDPAKTIAVIGDGSMTAGMAFEALNQAGHINKDLIVVLNDNEMSISPNVGALSSFLSRKLTGRTMRRLKDHLVDRLGQLSDVGENILTVLKKSEDSFKSFFTPGMLFEALKFDYVGPLNGHSFDELINTFETIRDTQQGPILIHVLTTKGKGYEPAEQNPGTFHGIGPFESDTGKTKGGGGSVSYTKVFGNTLTKIGRTNDKVIAISAAMVTGTGLTEFAENYPERFFDVGIAEQHAATFAAGLASEGYHPVVAIYSTFFQRSYDQIIHDICIPNLPVTLAIDRAGVVGADGPTHHGVFDLSFLRVIPNLIFMAPKDEEELRHMLFTAVNYNGPSALRYPRGCGENVELTANLKQLDIGRGELLKEGDDILLLPIGNRVHPALRAAQRLNKLGINAAVINPRFIKPLDKELICDWASTTGRVVTVEDNVKQGGFGSAILELFSRCGVSVKTSLLAHPDRFLEQGPQKTLWRNSSINSVAITEAALQLMNR